MQGVSKTDFENYVKANDAILRNMQNQGQGLQNQMTNLTEMLSKFVNSNTDSSSNSGSLPSNTVTNPKEDLKGITTQSGVAYKGHTIPITSSPKVVKRRTEVTKDTVFPTNNGITEDVQPLVVPVENQNPVSEPVDAPVSAPMPNPKPSIPYPSRRNDEKRRENADEQKEKFYEIFKDMSFEISFVDALTLMPKFASTLKALIGNKEKLSEMARTPLNEHCSAVILNKLPEKLGDPGRFLIPCKFPGMDECLALADLGASINLMPFSVWKKLNLPNLTLTCMTLELADRSISRPIGIAKDVNVKVGVFQFLADFVVIDFEPDPRVPLILRRCFLNTSRALIDMYEGELTLRVDNEAITYNLDQTSRYSEVLGFSDVIASGNPTPGYDPIVSNSSSTFTPFGDSDFQLLEEADAFLSLADDPTSPEVDESYYDPEGDILILEALLNSDPSPPPNQENYFLEIRKELKLYGTKTTKSSIDEPPEFRADFVVVDFEPDPLVPLILRRCFLKTSRALIDVYEGELTLRVDNEAITYNLDQTLRYSVNYSDMTANRINVVELAYEEYSQEVLGFSDGGLTGIVISDNSNNPLLELPEFESFHFDLDPSFPRPPPEPPDVEISLIIKTDAPVINNFDELNKDGCFDPGGDEIDVEDDDSFTFVIRIFLPFLTYPEVRILQKSKENDQNRTITDTGTELSVQKPKNAIKEGNTPRIDFCTKRSTKEAQECHIMDCHAGNPCELRFDLTDHNGDPIIERNGGTGFKGACEGLDT
ncbi:reverse transcriptase domain-containing protein [Tanacetum coccineum]